MDNDDRKELSQLGKNYVGIKVELQGIQRLLEKMETNQSKLTLIGERSLYLEETLKKTNQAIEKLFVLVRELKGFRLNERVESLEGSRKWFIVSVFAAVIGSIAWSLR